MPAVVFDHDTFVRLSRSRDFLAAHFAGPITLEEAARQACLSPFHYQKLFVRVFGETPHEFVTRLRMDRAKHLLAAADAPVTEVCFEVGFSSLGSFSSRFHELVGCPPSMYRRQIRSTFPVPGLWVPQLVPVCFLEYLGLGDT